VIRFFQKRKRLETSRLFALGCLIAPAFVAASAGAQTPDQTPPALRIHSPFDGPVWRLDVDEKENFAVLSNASNAAAIWSFDNPNQPLIARVPLRDEQHKRAHAVAMSPNGEIVAYSVPPLADASYRLRPASALIYVLHRSTGAVERIIDGRDNENDIVTRPQALRFSPDGKYLAAVLSNGCGLRVWSTADWRRVVKDDLGYDGGDQTVDRCCRETDGSVCDARRDTYDVRFIKGNRSELAILTSGDSGVRLYERAGDGFVVRKFARPEDLGLERPEGIAVSPDEKRLAIGDRRLEKDDVASDSLETNKISIAIVDPFELRPVGTQLQIRDDDLYFTGYILRSQKKLNDANLHRVAWLKAGGHEYIFAGGELPCARLKAALIQPTAETIQDSCLARWTVGEEDKDPLFIPVGSDQVMDLVAMPKHGGLLVATQKLIEFVQPDGRLLQLEGSKTFLQRNGIADFRDGQIDFKISDDARIVEFVDYRGSNPRTGEGTTRLTFDLNHMRVTPGSSGGAAGTAPNQNDNIVRNWKNTKAANPPLLWDRKLEGPDYWKDESYRSVAVLDSRKFVLLGSSEFLRVISYADKWGNQTPVTCREPVTAEAFRVNVTPDGTIAVSGHSDGTLRWYRILPQGDRCQLELLLSVYLFQENVPDGEWRWIAWRPSGEFARDSKAPMIAEWQTADAAGRVLLTSFKDVGPKWYREDLGKLALAPPPDRSPDEIRKTQTPDPQTISAQAAPAAQAVILADSSFIQKVDKETWPLHLQFDSKIEPKQLEIRIDGIRVGKTYLGRHYGPNEPIIFDRPPPSDEDAVVEVEIPLAQRKENVESVLCMYVDGHEQSSCGSMKWIAETFRPKKRRLWAVLVGISRYDEGLINLKFAENDVLDITELFVRDYENRVEHRVSKVPPDYQEIHINLAASPITEEARNAIKALGEKGHVRQFEPTKTDIMAALNDMVARMNAANKAEIGDDVFLFYFSGHGVVIAGKDEYRSTILATAKTPREATQPELVSTSLVLSEILDVINRTSYGQKIVALDACRSLKVLNTLPKSALPSGGRLKTEIDGMNLPVDLFYSSEEGQESSEVAGLVFDPSHKNQGNSLMTYALLLALSRTDRIGDEAAVIRIRDVHASLGHFFALDNEASAVRKLQKQYNWHSVQIPTFVPARWQYGSGLIRTLDDK
jgi:WD40 repeat protein